MNIENNHKTFKNVISDEIDKINLNINKVKIITKT